MESNPCSVRIRSSPSRFRPQQVPHTGLRGLPSIDAQWGESPGVIAQPDTSRKDRIHEVGRDDEGPAWCGARSIGPLERSQPREKRGEDPFGILEERTLPAPCAKDLPQSGCNPVPDPPPVPRSI